MKIYRIIGNEGRITIPYAIRQTVGFLPDDVVSFQLVDADSVLVRREALHARKLPCVKGVRSQAMVFCVRAWTGSVCARD